MTMPPEVARQRFSAARVARLSTVDGIGAPHLVPVTFAVRAETVVIAVDGKPKRSRELKRLRNIAENPAVCLLVDEYVEDWTRLWWVRADGNAVVRRADFAVQLGWLAEKYRQYQDDPPQGPLIEVTVHRWSGWSASQE